MMAKVIVRAQKIREDSWDGASGRYSLSHTKSADRACEELGASPFMAHPVGLLNYWAWNDIQNWAEELGG